MDTCSSGDAALDMLREEEYEVLITDYKMPRMDGEELIRTISESSEYQSQVGYLIMNSASEEIAEVAEDLGVLFHSKSGGLEVYRKITGEIEGISIEEAVNEDEFIDNS